MRTAKEIKAEIDQIERANKLHNEGGEGYEVSIESLCNELADALFAEKYTLENTVAMKAKWNALVKAGERNPVKLQEQVGCTLADLKKAIAIHNIK